MRRWFERLLSELHFELWIGDAAEIRCKRVSYPFSRPRFGTKCKSSFQRHGLCDIGLFLPLTQCSVVPNGFACTAGGTRHSFVISVD